MLRHHAIVVIVGLSAAACWSGEARRPVPEKAALDVAEETIRKIFRDDFRRLKDNPAGGKALAELLFREGKDTTDDWALRYVALTLARSIAVDAGDAVTALGAVAELSKSFAVDGPSLKADSISMRT